MIEQSIGLHIERQFYVIFVMRNKLYVYVLQYVTAPIRSRCSSCRFSHLPVADYALISQVGCVMQTHRAIVEEIKIFVASISSR